MTRQADLSRRILNHDRSALARAITLIESTSPDDRKKAAVLLTTILPNSGNSIRIAVTGIPGAGKSTLIDKLGMLLIEIGYNVAVLAVDPTSTKSGGSILGDKTRMTELARSDKAFIRPSPSQGISGGVAAKTAETILLCEAAGFDIIIVETMGVGQAELAVHNMVDFFLLLQIAGGGDELQGMKKGIVELADAIVFTKADGDNLKATQQARQQLKMALHYIPSQSDWQVPVMDCSALENRGIDTIWHTIEQYIDMQKASASFQDKRKEQNRKWMMSMVKNAVLELFLSDQHIKKQITELEKDILNDQILPSQAARNIIETIKQRYK